MNSAQTTTYRFSWYWNVQNEVAGRREHYKLEKAQRQSNDAFLVKSASTIGPGKGGTSYLTDFHET